MKRNQMKAMGMVVVIAAAGASAMAFASGIGSNPTAADLQDGALRALRAAGAEWATLDRDAAGSWNAHVLRADGSITDVRLDDQLRVVGVADAAVAASASVPAQAASDDDYEAPIAASDIERAGKAALDAVGGGTVKSVDRDREGGATWEVEVTKTDGTEVDVLLDAQFKVIRVGGEQEPNEGPDDASDDDNGQHDD
jgi:peptidase YpeB-like protein